MGPGRASGGRAVTVLSSHRRAAAPHFSPRRPARRPGSRASQECGREGGAGRVEAPIHLIVPAGARALKDRQRRRAGLPARRARAPGVGLEPRAPGFKPPRPPAAQSVRSQWPLGRCSAWSPGFSAHAELKLPDSSTVFLFVCVSAFLISYLLGTVSGWECVISPQGIGGFEEVKNVLR